MASAAELGVVSVQEVVEGIFGYQGDIRGDELDINCPNPAHPDNDPSTSINLETGYWHCFSCGVGGDLIELGLYAFDLPRDNWKQKRDSKKQVVDMLKPRSIDSLRVNVARKLATVTPRRRSSTKASNTLGPFEDGPLTSLRRRGFTVETLRRWGVRFVDRQELLGKKGNTFAIEASIAIPIRDEHGQLLSWCFRRTDSSPSWQPRYLYPSDAEISELWFGLQHHAWVPDITIVEGALDAMWLDQCGVPALALLGSQMGERKIRWLSRYRSVTILGDRDAGGLAAVQKIGNLIGNRTPLRVARYPKWMGDDPQELPPVDVEIIHARAVPWTTWVMMTERTA